MSPETIEFLTNLVNSLTLQASAPDFETTARLIVQAKRELAGDSDKAPTL